jgi:hypothetical protein
MDDLRLNHVDANHSLQGPGVVGAFGYVSVRRAHRAHRFLLARKVAPSHVSEGAIAAAVESRAHAYARGPNSACKSQGDSR